MAELQTLVSAVESAPGQQTGPNPYTPHDGGIPHHEHEVADVEQPARDGNEAAPESLGIEETNDGTQPQGDGTVPPRASKDTPQAVKSQSGGGRGKPASLSVKPPAGKSNGGPPTPLVKKVCSIHD